MKIDHIVWDECPTGDVVSGICDVEVFFHGGGTERIICEGTYTDTKARGLFFCRYLGEISEDTEGVSGVSLRRVGRIIP